MAEAPFDEGRALGMRDERGWADLQRRVERLGLNGPYRQAVDEVLTLMRQYETDTAAMSPRHADVSQPGPVPCPYPGCDGLVVEVRQASTWAPLLGGWGEHVVSLEPGLQDWQHEGFTCSSRADHVVDVDVPVQYQ